MCKELFYFSSTSLRSQFALKKKSASKGQVYSEELIILCLHCQYGWQTVIKESNICLTPDYSCILWLHTKFHEDCIKNIISINIRASALYAILWLKFAIQVVVTECCFHDSNNCH